MSIRTQHTIQDQLTTTVAELRHQVDQLKAPQRTSGASGVSAYFVQGASPWSGTIGTSSSGALYNNVTITFTGDGSQTYPFANLTFNISANGNLLQPSGDSIYWIGSSEYSSVSVSTVSVSFPSNIITLTFSLETYNQVSYVITGYAYASCQGSITVGVA